jgi:hypothetical protein
VQCIIKWPFFEGGRGKFGQNGILNCTMIDMQDCYPNYIISIHFDDLEKQSNHL